MNEYRYAIYNAFSDNVHGGSKAALVDGATDLNDAQMQQIAKDFSVPATGFITGIDADQVYIRFFSTQTEYPMCGHATIALVTWLRERGIDSDQLVLSTPQSVATLGIKQRNDGLIQVMLELEAASFESIAVDLTQIAELLGCPVEMLATGLPVALTHSDFVHLVVPVNGLKTMQSMSTDIDEIKNYCLNHGIDTIMVFTTETDSPNHTVHCREFAPAVGTAEAPASGTTNRALACYLYEYQVLTFPSDGVKTILSEQGVEMGRPSLVQTDVTLKTGRIDNIKVGGVATRSMEGILYFD